MKAKTAAVGHRVAVEEHEKRGDAFIPYAERVCRLLKVRPKTIIFGQSTASVFGH